MNAKLAETLTKVRHLKNKNNSMTDKLTAESQKCDLFDHDMKTLKAENANLHGKLKMVLFELDTTKTSLDKMNAVSKKLDDILSSQKAKTDNHGIGYTVGASTLNAKGKNNLVQSSVITNPIVDVAHAAARKKNVSRPAHIPTCHHYRIKGHIRTHYYKLQSSPKQMQ
eukprot:TRINITY_DN34142_c0_g1_i1.p1 TRINITY_DN34142_c0_g1~~TRINITY_DN34142_c0_g1_i1.p1  ORF type:complete len:168 (-),score=25.91 TRINITY_DN34142_c0_g1_i1:25-528(-)